MRVRHHSSPLLAALAALLALTAGCGKSPTSPSAAATAAQQNADDAAQQVAITMALGGAGSPGGAAVPSAAGRTTSPAAAETTFSTGAVTWTVTRAWYDALGNEQADFNPLTTVRMLGASRGLGTLATETDTVNFAGAGTLDVFGLSTLQDTLVTNAARQDTLLAAFTTMRGARVHAYSECTGTLVDVRQPKPLSANPWPVSGTATWVLHVSRLRSGARGDVSTTYDATVVVTFNGTRYVNAVVNGAFQYTIDLLGGGCARH